MKHIFCLTLAVLLSAANAFALSLNDLSILLPLPEADQIFSLLSPSEKGDQGVMIPAMSFRALPQLVPESSNAVTYRDQVKLIGVRIDPCFSEGTGPQACRRQIRMVWQPVILSGEKVTTRDAGVHSFYEFDETTFNQLLGEWRGLASGKETDALQIQPQIRKEGYNGAYWKKLRALLLHYCGEKNLVRLTGMNVMNGEMMWIFQGFDVVNGQMVPIKVARLQDGRTSQGVIQSSPQFNSFTGGMMPSPLEDRDFGKLVEDSATTKKQLSEQDIKAVISRAFEYENPMKHNPGTLDCASCHMAHSARQWAQVNYKSWNWASEFSGVAYQSTWNLESGSPAPLRTNRLRAFGYFTNEPAVSQRVINETATVAASIKNAEAAGLF